jgi:hypothetical protein
MEAVQREIMEEKAGALARTERRRRRADRHSPRGVLASRVAE